MHIHKSDPGVFASVEKTVVDLLLPLFLDRAGGEEVLARAMIQDQIEGYMPQSVSDLLRVGRIIGLRTTAVDSLRLSMDINQDIQQCWQVAASLSKEADRMVQLLNKTRAARDTIAVAVR